jgi:two-component system response regulator HydG
VPVPRPQVDTRVIAATNRELGPLVEEGKFRQDLFYRISVIPIRVPSLRERREDIPELAMHFIGRFSRRSGKSIGISDEALEVLQNRPWLGNVRELENTIERAVAFTPDSESISVQNCVDQASTNGHSKAHLPADGIHPADTSEQT